MPRIVKKVMAPDGTVLDVHEKRMGTQVIAPDTANAMLRMMEAATAPGGTAVRAAVDGLRMAVKTGTAQVYERSSASYSQDKYIASALGIFPIPDPEVIAYVAIENPKGEEYYGGRIAAPVIAEIAKDIGNYLRIPKSTDLVLHDGQGTYGMDRRRLIIEESVPSLYGLSKRDLLGLFGNSDIQLGISGEGWAVSQYPPAGWKIEPGMTIQAVLSE